MPALDYIAPISALEGNLHILFYQQKAQLLLPVNIIYSGKKVIHNIGLCWLLGPSVHKIDSSVILQLHVCLPFHLQERKKREKLYPPHHEKASRLRAKHASFAEHVEGSSLEGFVEST
jgi:hypothetical protein